MGKKVIFKEEASKKLQEGVNKIANIAAETMGQQGNLAILHQHVAAPPKVTKDGYYSIRHVQLEDEDENNAAQLVIEAARKSADEAGDGTTTCCVLTRELVNEGFKNIAAGARRKDITKGIDIAVDIVSTELMKMSQPVKRGTKMVEQVATVSANNNSEIGKQIAHVMSKIKDGGAIDVVSSNSLNSYTEVVEGMKIDRGFISPYFINNNKKYQCELNNPFILLHNETISSLSSILPIIEKSLQAGRGLVIISKDVNNEALASLIQNKMESGFPLAAVYAPGFGEGMMDELEDIAMVTGGTVISDQAGYSLEEAELEMLGEVDRVVITRNETTFIGGKGNKKTIKDRISFVRSELKDVTQKSHRDNLERRIANIDGGVAVMYVGGSTEAEVQEKKDLIEDAIAASKAALDSGVVPGGGSSLLLASKKLDNIPIDSDIALGINIVRKALYAPIKQIMKNAGEPEDMIVQKVLESKRKNAGFNLNTGTICDMVRAGILDTAKVEISALQNAASVSKLILRGTVSVTPTEEK